MEKLKLVFNIIFLSCVLMLSGCIGTSGGGSGHPIVPVPTSSVITSFSINNATGIIAGNKITVALPYGANVTSLVADFTLSNPANVLVNNVLQTSGITSNNFTTPQVYTLISPSTNKVVAEYTVAVLIGSKTDKAITSFSLSTTPGLSGTSGSITGQNINVTMPFGTDLSALIATFTTTGESVKVSGALQTSGKTTNNFKSPVLYTVTAAEGSTLVYTVNVFIAPNTAKEITRFSIDSNLGTITGHNISVIVPYGTNITSAVANYTTTGESVIVNSIPQISESSVNDFTNPVIYTVIAADNSKLDYTVTVTVVPYTAKELIDPFFINGYPGVINESQLTIDVTVPFGTSLEDMITTFTTTGESVTVNGIAQISGNLPSNNFESPVAYVVHAANGSTATYIVTVYATSNVWTWMGGSDEADAFGVYGESGVASLTNMPGSHYASASWIDSSGNMWLFGGGGNAESTSGSLNDLWKYTPSSGEWTWVGGSKQANQIGIYGTLGSPESRNIPGARYNSAYWTDKTGELWIFGGDVVDDDIGISAFNDLWKYSPKTGLWTWMGGESSAQQKGIYGNLGEPDTKNIPGARKNSTTWTDATGNFWLFGGNGFDAESKFGYLNDLWKYTPSSGSWTWMSGSKEINQTGIYGNLKESDIDNIPGARQYSIGWADKSGNLWLFGGTGHAESTFGYLNDLWKYNTSSGSWTWMSGSKEINSFGVYGESGIPQTLNMPGARGAGIPWTDTSGNLWLFGGIGYAESSTGALNDIWKYNVLTGAWTWGGGSKRSNEFSTYGTLVMPGGHFIMTGWADTSGNLWLFGGAGNAKSTTGYLNDLWKYHY